MGLEDRQNDRSEVANEYSLPTYDFSLSDLFSVEPVSSPLLEAVRRQQVAHFITVVPKFMLANFIFAAMSAVLMAPYVPNWQLLAWLTADLMPALFFARRHERLRVDADYRLKNPATFKTASFGTFVITFLWLAPAVFWWDLLPTLEQIVVASLGTILIAAGTFVLIYVPPAALAWLSVMTVAGFIVAWRFESVELAALVVLYAMALASVGLLIARDLFRQARGRLELAEMGELVELLRDLGAPGSGGLWELGADLRFRKVSDSLAAAIGRTTEQFIGLSVFKLIDPDGRYQNLSSGMRQLFGAFRSNEKFRDVVVPQVYTDRWWSMSGQPVFDEHGELLGWRGVASDVTALRTANADAVGAARSDPLTGIANRLLIRELLEEALLAQLADDEECALLLVDLDRFKFVNDTMGHAIGDELLCEVASRIEATVGEDGHVGRLGGDEFAIIWNGAIDRYTLSGLAERVIAEISRSVVVGASNIHVGATVGIAVGPHHGDREDKLMRSADLALYSAKRSGRGSYAFYEASMLEAAEDHRVLENDVRRALDDGNLSLAYQPIVDAMTGTLVGREALLRWDHPERGPVPPERFIPIIEDAGLINQIGDWVIAEACKQAAYWPKDLRVAVNVSAAQLSGAGLSKTVVNALARSGLAPDRLELEITESVFLGDDVATLNSIERLRGLGVRLVLDDFGKGYSSFGYLSRAQFAKIKIDRVFVRQAATGDKRGMAIIDAILALSRGLGIETTAEGIETEIEADAMRIRGVQSLQGFLFGRPERLDDDSDIEAAKVVNLDSRRQSR